MVAADFWAAAREFHRSLIKKGDPAGGVGHVDRCRQSVEQVTEMPTLVAALALVLDPLFRIPATWVLSNTVIS